MKMMLLRMPRSAAEEGVRWATRTRKIALHGCLLLLLVGLAGGCGNSKEGARRKLAALNMEYSPESFVRAAENGDLTAVKLFLDAGMGANGVTVDGQTALSAATIRGGHLPIVNVLLDRGANPNLAMSGKGLAGVTPLMLAAGGQNIDILKALLEKGANPDAASDAGTTALMFAVGQGNQEAVKFLLPRVKNINAKNKEGNTAVDVALEQKSADLLLPVLKEAGANLFTEKVVSLYSRDLADMVGSGLKKAITSFGSADKDSAINTLTSGLARLKTLGFSDQQMAVARKKVADAVENEVGRVVMINRLTRREGTKTDDEKQQDAFTGELYKNLMAQLK